MKSWVPREVGRELTVTREQRAKSYHHSMLREMAERSIRFGRKKKNPKVKTTSSAQGMQEMAVEGVPEGCIGVLQETVE